MFLKITVSVRVAGPKSDKFYHCQWNLSNLALAGQSSASLRLKNSVCPGPVELTATVLNAGLTLDGLQNNSEMGHKTFVTNQPKETHIFF